VTERFTGLEGGNSAWRDCLEGCERILADEFSEFDESDLFMIGPID
jgi:F-type H+/Na+-transporting ATPase subunit beta